MTKLNLLVLCTCTLSTLFAQVDTLNPQTNKLLLQNLKEGTSNYLVYTADSATGEIRYSDIWVRSINFANFNNTPAVVFDWKWYHRDSLYKTVTDICSRQTLAPLYAHTGGKRTGILAYNFTNGFMVAADTVAGNKANPATTIAMTIPVYDWQWDMETFSLLPYKKVGQQFSIAFFDPNYLAGKPQYYLHTVIGEENLVLNGEAKTKCWLLRIDYDKEAYAIFWISQKTHEMLKMKEGYKGMFRYKVKLY